VKLPTVAHLASIRLAALDVRRRQHTVKRIGCQLLRPSLAS
jgi:hypothetical protein